MDLLNHDLEHEFPQYLDKMRKLKKGDAHFAQLSAQYAKDNHAVASYEKGAAAINDEALEELKKKRLKTKDEIYQKLQRD